MNFLWRELNHISSSLQHWSCSGQVCRTHWCLRDLRPCGCWTARSNIVFCKSSYHSSPASLHLDFTLSSLLRFDSKWWKQFPHCRSLCTNLLYKRRTNSSPDQSAFKSAREQFISYQAAGLLFPNPIIIRKLSACCDNPPGQRGPG